MSLTVLVIFLVSCFIGAIIQSVSGFGFGIFVMTIFPFLLPNYVTGVTISQLLSMSMTLFLAITMRKEAMPKLIILPLIGYAISNAICITLSLTQSDAILKKCLGVFLFALSIYFVFYSKKVKIKPNKINGFIAGLLSGGLSGMFGAGGPPMVIYLLAVTDTPRQYLATIQCFFAISSMYNISMRFLNGMVTPVVLQFSALGIFVVFAGIYIGKKLLVKINPETLKKIVYIFMAFSGIVMFFTA